MDTMAGLLGRTTVAPPRQEANERRVFNCAMFESFGKMKTLTYDDLVLTLGADDDGGGSGDGRFGSER